MQREREPWEIPWGNGNYNLKYQDSSESGNRHRAGRDKIICRLSWACWEKKQLLYHLLCRRRGILLDRNPASYQDSITAEWLKELEQTPFGDVISGGMVRTLRFWVHPRGGTDAWISVIAELRVSPSLDNCPPVSEIKQLNVREELAINMVMKMNTFIKLTFEKGGRLENKGWERNMLFWSSFEGLSGTSWKDSHFICPRSLRACIKFKHLWILCIDDLNSSIQFRPRE